MDNPIRVAVMGCNGRMGKVLLEAITHADGVVVGSALVSALDGSVDEADAAARAGDFLRPLRAALDGLAVAA